MTTATDIRVALRTRYPAGQFALLWEVANATGANQRRFADAVAVGLWPSHGHEIEGIEIKVSRSDFLHEMKQPEKSQPVYRFCNRWWLAAPKGLVAPEELPETWGLLELVGDVMRVKKKAPALGREPPTTGFVASLLRRHAGVDSEMTEALLKEETRKIQEESRKEIEATLRRERERDRLGIANAMEKLDAIAAATGFDFRRDYRQPTQWVNALKFLMGQDYGEWFTAEALARVRHQCEEMITSIDAMPNIKNEEAA